MEKDFTLSQAHRWVQQEKAKHTTADSIRGRITSERRQQRMFADVNLDKLYPNSMKAHETLIAELEQTLREMEH